MVLEVAREDFGAVPEVVTLWRDIVSYWEPATEVPEAVGRGRLPTVGLTRRGEDAGGVLREGCTLHSGVGL